MNQNLVTNTHISPAALVAMRDASATLAPLELTPYDAPYYFVRIDRTRGLRDQVITNPYATQRVTEWRQVPVDSDTREELEFLESMGLAMPLSQSLYAVSPLAVETLYDAEEGVFVNADQNREQKSRRFVELLLTYVLPGMYWRNYYVTKGLARNLHLVAELQREMIEVTESWDRLAAIFPLA